jgi:hypothetical protein
LYKIQILAGEKFLILAGEKKFLSFLAGEKISSGAHQEDCDQHTHFVEDYLRNI